MARPWKKSMLPNTGPETRQQMCKFTTIWGADSEQGNPSMRVEQVYNITNTGLISAQNVEVMCGGVYNTYTNTCYISKK